MNAPDKTPAPALPIWDLSDLYASREAPELARDIAAARKATAELARMKGSFLGARGNPDRLGLLFWGVLTTVLKSPDLL